MLIPSRTARYSGSERPACRMNHTGVCGTASPRAARRKAESASSGEEVVTGVAMEGSSQVRAASRVPGSAVATYSEAMPASHELHLDQAPAEFERAVGQLREASFRPEVLVEEMPAPQRIAPYASALSADVTVAGEDVATGRIVLLHDPAGNDAWNGTFRCVAYVRADIDPELVSDPLLAEVGWSWLTEALEAHGAEYTAPSGTVTSVASESFGGMAGEPASAQIEIRASWTPVADLGEHVEAWGELLCTAAGLPPVPAGVATIPSRRGQRGA